MLRFFFRKSAETKLFEAMSKRFKSLYIETHKNNLRTNRFADLERRPYGMIRSNILASFLPIEVFHSVKKELKLDDTITFDVYKRMVMRVSYQELEKLQPNVSGNEDDYYTY